MIRAAGVRDKETDAMDFEAIKGLAKHHKQVFGRIVKCEMYKMEDGNVLALALFFACARLTWNGWSRSKHRSPGA